MGEGEKDRKQVQDGPHPTPIHDPDFAEVITDDLAADAGEGLHLTRDPEKKSKSEPGIKLEELGVEPKKTSK